jgi:hypothetical protein
MAYAASPRSMASQTSPRPAGLLTPWLGHTPRQLPIRYPGRMRITLALGQQRRTWRPAQRTTAMSTPETRRQDARPF